MNTKLISRIRRRIARAIQPVERPSFTTVGTCGPLNIELTDSPCKEAAYVSNALHAYNSQLVGNSEYRPLHLVLRNTAGRVVGGLLGSTYWHWLSLEYLWIDPEYRKDGTVVFSLFDAAEQEALRRGCDWACLDTFSFQDRLPLYRLLGYEVIGVLEDLPPGHQKFFMKKSLRHSTDTEGERQAGATGARA